MKKKKVILLIAALLSSIVLILGVKLYHYANQLNSKEILSNHAARSQIESLLTIDLPENAHQLYYAHTRILFIDHFAAFTLQSKEECEALLDQMNCPLDKFVKKQIRSRSDSSTVGLKAGGRTTQIVTGNCQMRLILCCMTTVSP